MATTTSAPTGAVGASLRANCLNYWEILAQSIALISPTMTAVLIVPVMFGTAGNGSWMAYLFGMVMLLFVALCLNEFAKRSTTSGSMYAYVTRGMGSVGGGLTGWCLIWAYLFIGLAGLTGFTNFAEILLGMMGVPAGILSTVWMSLLCCAVCLGTSYVLAIRDVRLSAVLMLVLEGVSIALIVALGIFVLFHKGIPIDHAQIKMTGTTPSMIAFGVVIAIFSLVGFEAATAFGDEAKAPLVNIPKAVVWSLILTGTFFVFATYMEVYGTKDYSQTLDKLTAPLNTLADIYHVSWLGVPISIGALLSFFSLNLSCLNSGARVMFKMGSHKVFHESVGKAHATNATPHVAATIVAIMMALVITGLFLWHNVDTELFGYVGTFGAFGFLGAYYLVSIAAPLYLKKIGELRPKHVIISAIALLLLTVPAVGSVYTNPPLAPPVSYFVYIFLAYFAVGLVMCLMQRGRSSEVMESVTKDLELTTHGTAGIAAEQTSA